MARSAKRNQTMREETHSAILDAAMQLFAQNGYAHTSTRSIAQAAGISTGLLYHYFAGKEDLLRAVFAHCIAMLDANFTEAVTQCAPDERLSALLRAIFAQLVSDKEFWALFYMLRTQPAISQILGDDFRLWTHRLRAVFTAELQETERPDPTLDAYLLYCLIEGTIQQYLLEPETYPIDQIADRIITDFCN